MKGPAMTVNVTTSGRCLSRSFIDPQSGEDAWAEWSMSELGHLPRNFVILVVRAPQINVPARATRASAGCFDSPTALEMLEALVGPGRRLPARCRAMSSKDNRRPVFKRPIYSDPQRQQRSLREVYIKGSVSVHPGIHVLKAGADLDYGSIHKRFHDLI
jgi:hypothetical protein